MCLSLLLISAWSESSVLGQGKQKDKVSELPTPHLTRLEMYRMHQCGVGSNIKFYCLFLAKDSEAACEEAMVGSGGH